MDGYYKKMAKLLRQHDYTRDRSNGSHQTWTHPQREQITVSTNIKDRHLANFLLKKTGISHRF